MLLYLPLLEQNQSLFSLSLCGLTLITPLWEYKHAFPSNTTITCPSRLLVIGKIKSLTCGWPATSGSPWARARAASCPRSASTCEAWHTSRATVPATVQAIPCRAARLAWELNLTWLAPDSSRPRRHIGHTARPDRMPSLRLSTPMVKRPVSAGPRGTRRLQSQ